MIFKSANILTGSLAGRSSLLITQTWKEIAEPKLCYASCAQRVKRASEVVAVTLLGVSYLVWC